MARPPPRKNPTSNTAQHRQRPKMSVPTNSAPSHSNSHSSGSSGVTSSFTSPLDINTTTYTHDASSPFYYNSIPPLNPLNHSPPHRSPPMSPPPPSPIRPQRANTSNPVKYVALWALRSPLRIARKAFLFKPPASLPLKQTLLLLTTVLPEILIHHMLIPLYPYMTRALLPKEHAERTGYYAGLLQSAYALPTTFMDAIWGNLSDAIGRGPVLMTGLIGYGVGTLALGLSTSYWLSVISLGATGFFSSNAVVAKGMIGQIAHDDASRAWAYSAYGVVFSLAGLAGTLAGGFLADPALFSHIAFLRDRPYFVACSIGTLLAAVGVCITIKYLLHAPGHNHAAKYAALDAAETGLPDSDTMDPMQLSTHTLPRFLRYLPAFLRPYFQLLSATTLPPILLYATYKLVHSLFHTALPLLASAPTSAGGLGLPAKSTSLAMSLLSLAKLLLKAFYFPIHRTIGTKHSYTLGAALIVPAALIPPLLGHTYTWPAIYASTLLIGAGEGLCYLSTIMLLTDAVGPQHYGLIHGVAGCLGSVMKTLGPAIAGAVWQVGVQADAIWIIFAAVAAVAALGVTLSSGMKVRRWEECVMDDEGDEGERTD
ncbi:major facilitator superfamily domain-containing protein [Powellomyces hirtus]|nr:major facilitator superfamily domain-containing protein [Powellomyces hirtus]